MSEIAELINNYGYLLLFFVVLAEQLGLPLPAAPILLAAGAFAKTGDLQLGLVLLVALMASMTSDLLWYFVGRHRGAAVLQLLCRVSLEPDSCVRQTENVFARHGAKTLLVAKYIPGIATVAPPLAGMFYMRFPRFFIFDLIGSIFYLGPFILLGYLLGDELEAIAGVSGQVGTLLAALLVMAFVLYLGWKYFKRRRFMRELRIARISPEELNEKIARGENLVIVDLRHSLDFEADPVTLPGALRISPDELETRHGELPRDHDLILYCT